MAEKEGVPDVAHYDMIYLKPVDEDLLHEVALQYDTIITVENGVIKGGLGSAVLEFLADNGYKNSVKRIGIGDEFVEHGSIVELYKLCGLDAEGIKDVLCGRVSLTNKI
jgi:1-deoxy-D-xylulose-5-phosphate synthase